MPRCDEHATSSAADLGRPSFGIPALINTHHAAAVRGLYPQSSRSRNVRLLVISRKRASNAQCTSITPIDREQEDTSGHPADHDSEHTCTCASQKRTAAAQPYKDECRTQQCIGKVNPCAVASV